MLENAITIRLALPHKLVDVLGQLKAGAMPRTRLEAVSVINE